MKCAFCGNEDLAFLHDEGDTFYCKKCTHRTRVGDWRDDVLRCPYCHRMRDRKAMYCRFCNDVSWETSTPEEFQEIDELLRSMGY